MCISICWAIGGANLSLIALKKYKKKIRKNKKCK